MRNSFKERYFLRKLRAATAWRLLAVAGLFWLARPADAAWQTIISNTFASANFHTYWGNAYPWGNSHNGSALMFASNVVVNNGMVTLTATPIPGAAGSEGTVTSGGNTITIAYNSGTIYLYHEITVSPNYPMWDISFQCKVPSISGTWPAVWMTGANSWPPESDFMEYKGSATCWQNTYDGSWQTKTTAMTSPGASWHSYRVVANLENSTNVDFHYFIDGNLTSEQTSKTFVNAPCHLIIDFQTGGSSGTASYTTAQYFYISNLVIMAENVTGIAQNPLANGAYRLSVRSTGDALDVGNQNTGNNSSLDQYPNNGGLNQQWTVTSLGSGNYSLIGRQSGRALQVQNSSAANGAGVVIADYTGASNQIWKLAAISGGYYNLINAASSKAMQVRNNSTANVAAVEQWTPGASGQFSGASAGAPNATWRLILSASQGIPGNSYDVLSSADPGAPVSGWSVRANIVADANGNFAFTNTSAAPQEFYRIRLPSNGGYNQQWSFTAQ